MITKKWLGMMSSVGLPLLFGVIVFVLWQTQALHSWLGTDTITLPLPTRIGEIISQNKDSVGSQVKMTLTVALGGLVAGSILGYLIAVIASIFRKWGAGGLTIVSAFNAIPIVALAPVINNWTRDVSSDVSIRSTLAKIIVVTISCTAAMSVNAFRGLTELKPFSEDLMTSYAAPKIVVFTKLRLPNFHGAEGQRSGERHRRAGNGVFRGGHGGRRQADTREHRQGTVPHRVGVYRDGMRDRNRNVHNPHAG